MATESQILGVKIANLPRIIEFLQSQLLEDKHARSNHACILMVLPLGAEPPRPGDLKVDGVAWASGVYGLTEREASVLKRVTDGRSNAQIALELNTTVGSINRMGGPSRTRAAR
jgi:DNA-binding NarL/FixJ family response regulator